MLRLPALPAPPARPNPSADRPRGARAGVPTAACAGDAEQLGGLGQDPGQLLLGSLLLAVQGVEHVQAGGQPGHQPLTHLEPPLHRGDVDDAH